MPDSAVARPGTLSLRPMEALFSRGDVNGFFALAVDNLAVIAGMAGILIGVFGMPAEVVLGRMVPGTAIGVLAGNLAYVWLAWRLARATGRHDVCAMPFGVDTPSMFGLSFGVVGPTWAMTRDAHLAWCTGMATLVLMGVAKTATAFAGDWIRRQVPRAALLGAISAIGVGLIVFFPLTRIFSEPAGGLVALGVVLAGLLGRGTLGRLPVPPVVLAVLLGLAATVLAGWAGLRGAAHTGAAWEGALALPWPSLQFVDGLDRALTLLPLALPLALATVIGGIDNAESAALAGDAYRTRDILLTEGLATLLAGLCGGVVQNTPYIGHPAYRAMGCRSGYLLANGLVLGIGACLGAVGWLVSWLPEALLVPVLVFVGLEIGAQAARHTEARHLPAVMICLAPAVAAVVNIELGGLLGTLGLGPEALGAWAARREALLLLGNGFVVSGMVWATLVARLIDRDLPAAARTSLLAAVFTLCGAMHSPFADGRMFLPGAATPTVVFSVVGGYALLALCFLLFHAWNRCEAPSP